MYCVFDGGLAIQEYEPFLKTMPHPSSALKTEFVRGEGMGGGVGGMVYSIKLPAYDSGDPESIICSHANHRGDVIARSNNNRSLTSFALYEAYGTRPYEWGDDPDRQKANTKEEESDLNLLNEGMRFRDLETGVFLTRDPIGYGDGPNVYCYVHCNPVNKFDALGLSEDDADEYDEMDEEEFEEEVKDESIDPDVDNNPFSETGWQTEYVNAPSRADIATQMNNQKANNELSSSSAENRENGYKTQNRAAEAALNAANPQSIKDNKEYGGFIYKMPNGRYSYTEPRAAKGEGHSSIVLDSSWVPDGAKDVGMYHCHGDYSDIEGNRVAKGDAYYDADNESPFRNQEDEGTLKFYASQREDKSESYSSYIGTPSGQFHEQHASGNRGQNVSRLNRDWSEQVLNKY